MKATPDNPRRLGNGRGRRGLDRDAIVRTARRITRKHGFDALSMPTLARELGVGTMSIYRHVPDKRSLVGPVVDSFLSEVEVPPASMGSWDERLLALKRNLIKAYARVPGMATASLESTPGPEATRLLDAHYRILLDAGFSGPEAVRADSTLLIFTLGALVSERIGMPAAAAGTDGPADGYSAIKQVAAAAAEMDRSTSIDVGLAVIVAALARELADKATGDKPATATARPGARGAGKSGDDRSPILATRWASAHGQRPRRGSSTMTTSTRLRCPQDPTEAQPKPLRRSNNTQATLHPRDAWLSRNDISSRCRRSNRAGNLGAPAITAASWVRRHECQARPLSINENPSHLEEANGSTNS